jgi:hypothetical protein
MHTLSCSQNLMEANYVPSTIRNCRMSHGSTTEHFVTLAETMNFHRSVLFLLNRYDMLFALKGRLKYEETRIV